MSGELIIEGKTKSVFKRPDYEVLVVNKDKITAGDGARAHELQGKAAISNSTNAKIFSFLNSAGLKTSWIRKENENSYIARHCDMIPIEWVTRRIATGSFLRRHPKVKEGYRFSPPKLETFFKDDANHDPQWSREEVLEAGLVISGKTIGAAEYEIMAKMTVTVFEVLERAWDSLDCALIDMKIEFGIDTLTKEIVVSDVIDSDSWRLWPSGDKRLMKDKQVYRDLKNVTGAALDQVKRNFQWVADKLDSFLITPKALTVILMGSIGDKPHCEKIGEHCKKLGVPFELRVASAHKSTATTLNIIAEYESKQIPIVFIAVAGRSNGLGPVASANTTYPVINCPPLNDGNKLMDSWSSLNLPSGLSCTTVLYPEAAAQAAALIFGMHDHMIWSKLRVKQLNLWLTLKKADQEILAQED